MRRIVVLVQSVRFRSLTAGVFVAACLGVVFLGAGAGAAAPPRHSRVPTGGRLAKLTWIGPAPYGTYNHSQGPAGALGRKAVRNAALGTGRALGMFPPGHPGAGRRGARVVLGPEIVSRRTVNSDTYWGSDGEMIVRVFAGPVNYRNAAGKMVPINDTLHMSGSAFVNQADSYTVSIPNTLTGSTPVRVSRGVQRLSFALLGARGGAQAPRSNAVSFKDVLPDTSLSYVAAPGRVKEDIRMASSAAPSRFQFFLRVAQGARGGAASRGGRGARPAPPGCLLAADAVLDRPLGCGRVAVGMVGTKAGYLVTWTPDAAWMRSTSRRWPVVLDPSVGAGPDCTIVGGSGASQNSCASASDTIGVERKRNRQQ